MFKQIGLYSLTVAQYTEPVFKNFWYKGVAINLFGIC